MSSGNPIRPSARPRPTAAPRPGSETDAQSVEAARAQAVQQDQRLRQATGQARPDVDAPRVAGRSLKRPGQAEPDPYAGYGQPGVPQQGGYPQQPGYPQYPPGTYAPGGMLPPGPGGATPFASHQVDFGSNAAPSSANSLRVITIVFGLMFMIGAAAVAGLAILMLGLFGIGGADLVAGAGGKDKKEHLRDTGAVDDPNLQKLQQKKVAGAKAKAEAEYDPMKEMFGGLGAAPVTVYVQGKGKEEYRNIEIICSQVGYRKRADIVADKAHIPIVPAARCRLVFQGNVPVKSWVTGGDTVRCTFEPIVCKPI
ncbi:MAG: hypothetical protein H6737_16425 [Alphaproteobacteria bacterium]|nr:hypothetical protein [Alphaproteobacteria bacterium]